MPLGGVVGSGPALRRRRTFRRGRGERRRRTIVAVVVAAAGVLVLAGAGAGYLLLRTHGSPQQTAASYLSAWQRGDYRAMGKVSVHVPHGGLAAPVGQFASQVGVRHLHLVLGKVTPDSAGAQARFTATADLVSNHVWTYTGQLQLVRQNRAWWVSWSPSAIYPGLKPGDRFVLHAVWPARGQILGTGGTVLSSPTTVAQSGSISLLTGAIVAATAAQAKALGAPYQKGDLIGEGGIEQAYQARLAGRPSLTIQIEGRGKHVDVTAAHFPSVAGQPVQTSIDMRYQLAASHAVSAASTNKPIDMVVLQPSTGKVLAVIERPGGFDRALSGIFPPGSTFKIVTASALSRKGLRPSTSVQCPATVNIGGRTFHNFDNERLGSTSLLNAFAVSCNTTLRCSRRSTSTGRRWGRWQRRLASTPSRPLVSRRRSGISPPSASRSTWRPTRSARGRTWSTPSARPPWRRLSKTGPGGRRSWWSIPRRSSPARRARSAPGSLARCAR